MWLSPAMILLITATWQAPASAPVQDEAQMTEAAVKAAEAWLLLADGGKYRESWEQASSFFRAAVTPLQWEQSLRTARGALGPLVKRVKLDARYLTSLPGAPPGQYVVIQYQSGFQNREAVVETVTPMKDRDGVWRGSGYFAQ